MASVIQSNFRVRKNLGEMEKAGWSLPVYREMILEDATRIVF